MAIKRIDESKKKVYQTLSQPIKDEIEALKKKIQELELGSLRGEAEIMKYKPFLIANYYVDIALRLMKMNNLSIKVMDLKQGEVLENARKNIYTAISVLEKLVGSEVDNDLSGSDERLKGTEKMTPYRKLFLFKRIELALKLLQEYLEDDPKFKYKILEMFSKFAVVVKNSINFKEFTSMSPMDPNYRYYNELVTYAKELLRKCADEYREKYEVSGHEVSDMRKAQEYLKALMRINNILGYYDESKEIKKIIEKWSSKMEEDLKAKEKRK